VISGTGSAFDVDLLLLCIGSLLDSRPRMDCESAIVSEPPEYMRGRVYIGPAAPRCKLGASGAGVVILEGRRGPPMYAP
jgi:hypothetical protein